jgi:hypothetical protein
MQISFQQAWLPTPSTVPDHTSTAADVIPLILVLVRACILTLGLIFACGSNCLEWLRSNYITRNLMGMSYNHCLRSILWTRWLHYMFQLPQYRALRVYIVACPALCRPLCWFYSFHSTLFTDRHESFLGCFRRLVIAPLVKVNAESRASGSSYECDDSFHCFICAGIELYCFKSHKSICVSFTIGLKFSCTANQWRSFSQPLWNYFYLSDSSSVCPKKSHMAAGQTIRFLPWWPVYKPGVGIQKSWVCSLLLLRRILFDQWTWPSM